MNLTKFKIMKSENVKTRVRIYLDDNSKPSMSIQEFNQLKATFQHYDGKLEIGICESIIFSASSIDILNFDCLALSIPSKRPVLVVPGKTLFTVIPVSASSNKSVLDQLAIAPRIVLDTPKPIIG